MDGLSHRGWGAGLPLTRGRGGGSHRGGPPTHSPRLHPPFKIPAFNRSKLFSGALVSTKNVLPRLWRLYKLGTTGSPVLPPPPPRDLLEFSFRQRGGGDPWAPRTRKRHQQEHRPQRPTERSDPTQHAKGRTGDCPGPRKGATTRRTVTQGGGTSPPPPLPRSSKSLPPPPPPPCWLLLGGGGVRAWAHPRKSPSPSPRDAVP